MPSTSYLVYPGATLTVDPSSNVTITVDSSIGSGGLLDGAGTISGGGTLTNLGTIAADSPSRVLTIATGALDNQGTISASGAPITIGSAVAVANLSGTTLTGGVWAASGGGDLTFTAGPIVVDNATIVLDGTASTFHVRNGGVTRSLETSLNTIGTNGVLEVLSGQTFQASDSLQVNGVLTLGGGTLSAGNGVTVAAGGSLTGFGTVTSTQAIWADGLFEANGGTLALPTLQAVSGGGTLQSDAGAILALPAVGTYSETIINNGVIQVINNSILGTLAPGANYQGTGSFLIQGGFPGLALTVLELPSTVTGAVDFDTNAGELLLDSPGSYTGAVVHFGTNDSIVLSGITADTAALTGHSLALISNNSTVQTINIDAGTMDYSTATFSVRQNVDNNAVVTVSGARAAACYRAGTRILTQTGEIAIEDLAAGDRVITHSARLAPVVWVGRRRVDCRRHPDPMKVWPIRVASDAFAVGSPHRDLWISPDHAVFVDDALVPIRHLINGATIAQIEMDEVTYYHVELADHDVVFAEGLPAETYLENGDRSSFDNGGGPVALFPDFGARRLEALGYAPLLQTGARLEAIRRRLEARARSKRKPARAA